MTAPPCIQPHLPGFMPRRCITRHHQHIAGQPIIVSVHYYEMADSASDQDFCEALREAERQDLFDLPGLVDYHFLYGIKRA